MASIPTIVSDLEYSRSTLRQSIEGLSRRELTELPIYEGWTIKEVLAHVIGWDQRVLRSLPLILQNRASEVASVEVGAHNQQSVQAWRDKSLAEVMAAERASHAQILEIVSALDHVEIELRRERNGRIITIRSYVIDIMMEHDRQHAAEIELWRKALEQAVDPDASKATLLQTRTDFLAAINGLSEADALAKNAIGTWSVKDLVGHIIDWEWLMLEAARHIHDPSLPAVSPLPGSEDQVNERLAAKRAANSWPQELQALAQVHQAVHDFVTGLTLGDLNLRGPYPWPNDQGTLAELLWHLATHYTDHLPALKNWLAEKNSHESQP